MGSVPYASALACTTIPGKHVEHTTSLKHEAGTFQPTQHSANCTAQATTPIKRLQLSWLLLGAAGLAASEVHLHLHYTPQLAVVCYVGCASVGCMHMIC